jgi:alpha-D-ribose 1-methylphosphonate 5-triphosphate synthase subunit PhnG
MLCVLLVMSAVNVVHLLVSFSFLMARLKRTSNIAAAVQAHMQQDLPERNANVCVLVQQLRR